MSDASIKGVTKAEKSKKKKKKEGRKIKKTQRMINKSVPVGLFLN
jgi:hypothetical protein